MMRKRQFRKLEADLWLRKNINRRILLYTVKNTVHFEEEKMKRKFIRNKHIV